MVKILKTWTLKINAVILLQYGQTNKDMLTDQSNYFPLPLIYLHSSNQTELPCLTITHTSLASHFLDIGEQC